jgi:glutaredoxin
MSTAGKQVILCLLLCTLGGLIQNQHRLARWFHPPKVSHVGSARVVLYGTTWCGYCAQAREFLTQEKIPYRDLDVERTDEGQAGYARWGGGGVPIIVIDDSKVIRGFSADAIVAALQ